tara:strand:- start:125 stop:448 length:324 start_codon:yes stop_codon:yes gene_type:complete
MKITRRQLRTIIKEAMDDSGAPYNDSLADLRDGSFSAKAQQKWLAWGEGYGLQQEEDNEGQIIFYFDISFDEDGTIVREAERMGGSVEPAGYSDDGNMIIYTDAYMS